MSAYGQLRDIDLLMPAVPAPEGPYGCGMIRRARMRIERAFELRDGRVCPVLHELERDGLVRSDRWTAGGRRRRPYANTLKGRAEPAERSEARRRAARAIGAALETVG